MRDEREAIDGRFGTRKLLLNAQLRFKGDFSRPFYGIVSAKNFKAERIFET